MNNITQETKKVVVVHNNIIILFLVIFFPIIIKGQSFDDYKILEVLFHNKDSVILSKIADNISLKEIFKNNINDSIFISAEKNRAWILKEKTNSSPVEIEKQLEENIAILKIVFTKENYDFMHNQMSYFIWNEMDINKNISLKNIIIEKENHNAIYYVSKPIYTKDHKYAIVKYRYYKMNSIIILVRQYNNWNILQFIPLGFG